MNDSQKYLKARNDIKDFYQVVWDESLRKTIKELAEKIKEYDANIYEKLDGKLYEDESAIEDEDHSTLGELMQSLFNHIKPLDEREFVEATGELKEPTESELYDEEKTILLRNLNSLRR